MMHIGAIFGTIMTANVWMTILPARLLEDRCPELARRGRLSAGSAADVTVFDPATIADRSTIEKTWLPSVGVHHVVVSGQVVREAGTTDRTVRPGVPLLGRPLPGGTGT